MNRTHTVHLKFDPDDIDGLTFNVDTLGVPEPCNVPAWPVLKHFPEFEVFDPDVDVFRLTYSYGPSNDSSLRCFRLSMLKHTAIMHDLGKVGVSSKFSLHQAHRLFWGYFTDPHTDKSVSIDFYMKLEKTRA